MGAQALPLPGQGSGATPGGPSPTGMAASPAPAVPDQGARVVSNTLMQIISMSRMIGKQFPAALEGVRMINDGVQQVQKAITAQQPPAEPMAPPV